MRAREEESSASMGKDLGELKKRLGDEQQGRRQAEAAAGDLRDEYESELTKLQARQEELQQALEERERNVRALRSELDGASEQRSLLAEVQSRAKGLSSELEQAQDRIRELEAALEEQEAASALEQELAVAHHERDELMTKLRSTERRLTDERGQVASLQSQNENLRRKVDEGRSRHRQDAESQQERYDGIVEENRRLKEKLAGLNARVRTLTVI
jgi:chromosome segregation ATPase